VTTYFETIHLLFPQCQTATDTLTADKQMETIFNILHCYTIKVNDTHTRRRLLHKVMQKKNKTVCDSDRQHNKMHTQFLNITSF